MFALMNSHTIRRPRDAAHKVSASERPEPHLSRGRRALVGRWISTPDTGKLAWMWRIQEGEDGRMRGWLQAA